MLVVPVFELLAPNGVADVPLYWITCAKHATLPVHEIVGAASEPFTMSQHKLTVQFAPLLTCAIFVQPVPDTLCVALFLLPQIAINRSPLVRVVGRAGAREVAPDEFALEPTAT